MRCAPPHAAGAAPWAAHGEVSPRVAAASCASELAPSQAAAADAAAGRRGFADMWLFWRARNRFSIEELRCVPPPSPVSLGIFAGRRPQICAAVGRRSQYTIPAGPVKYRLFFCSKPIGLVRNRSQLLPVTGLIHISVIVGCLIRLRRLFCMLFSLV
jgi:hypothetical protein